MTKNYYLTYFIILIYNLSFGQNPPLPPTPEEIKSYSSKNKAFGDSKNDNTGQKNKAVKPIEISEINNISTQEEIPQNIIPKFNVSRKELTEVNSIYYFKKIEDQIIKLDTLVSAEQIISLTKYKIYSNTINPTYLDSLAQKAYKLNEDKNYNMAIEVAKQILIQSPNNITAHKEIAFAYKHIDNNNLSKLHFLLMVKIIKSILKYGDGSRENPYILNNFFEGLSIYEAKFGCFPKKVRLILTAEKKLLGGYDCYHVMRFSDMTHWLPSLKVEDYKVEQ